MKNKGPERMKTIKTALLLGLLLFLIIPLYAEGELHGLQILSPDWAFAADNAGKQAALQKLIADAPQKGYNALFFQVRDAGECFYPSKHGTWSTKFQEQDPGFDPLDIAIREARKNKLQLFVQMDVLGAYNVVNKPKSPEHIFNKAGKKWVLTDDNQQPLTHDIFYFLDPSDPGVLAYLKDQVRELAAVYEIDGFYFTNIKYPDDRVLRTKAFSDRYERVRSFTKNDKVSFAQDIITSALEAMVCEIKMIKPYLTIFAETEPLVTEKKSIRNVNPADTYHFQKGISWLEDGIVDVLVPRIHARINIFTRFYETYLEQAGETYAPFIIPALRGDEDNYRDNDIKRAYEQIMKNNGKGALISSASDGLGKSPFDKKTSMPYLTRAHTGYAYIGIDLAQKSVPENIIKVNQDKRYRFLDKDAELSIATKSLPSNLTLESMKERMRFSTRGWTVPYRYRILPDNNPVRPDMFIELRRTPAIMTSDSSFHFLFRSSPGVTRINEHVLDAYPNTGIFFTEIPFHSYGRGTRVRGSVSRDGETLFYENIYYGNMPDTTTKHAVILNSVSPQGSVLLPPDDVLRITFESHLADQMDTILLYANGNPLPLWYNGNRYVGNISCASYQNVDSVYIQVAARDKRGEKYSYNLPVSLKVRKPQHFPVIETKEDFIPVSYSLGVVRLGGPYINEFPKGVRFVTDGKFGPNYRIRLNKNETAYVHERHVKVLPAGMPAPQYYISSMNVYVDSTSEVVTIPWPEPVPYAMTPQPEQKRIRIRLYGVQSISTWLSHREGLKIIDYVTWEQKDAETYDVYIQLKTDNIWGYELIQRNRHLEFRVKYPPKKKDMLIAIEAGHGGDWNWGAVGLSGLLEKDVNRDTAEKLRDMLRKKGYKVVEIRPEDTVPSLRDRWLLTDSLKADVFISIHANAAGGHYLRVGGTSTYYNDPFWRDFAELTYGKLRELPLEEFGIVGSFNYMMCRMPQRPSILVELAFMSHAEDENKMADPAFRATMAEKIAEAVHAYIEQKLRSAVK